MSLPYRAWTRRFNNERRLTVVTWNCLAQSLVSGFDGVAEEALAWEHRSKLMARELWRCLGTEQPESVAAVICLQEVDEACVESLVAEARLGTYERVYVRKGAEGEAQRWADAKESGTEAAFGEPRERPDGGMLVLHNVARFYGECAPVAATIVRYADPETGEPHSQRGLVLAFGSTDLVVAATHLKAKSGFEAVRHAQINQLMYAMTTASPATFWSEQAIIVGDFNEPPEAEGGGDGVLDHLKMHGFADLCNELRWLSSGDEWPWTTLKTRSGATKACIEDYIVIGRRVEFEAALGRICGSLATDYPHAGKQLLSSTYPSDHVALAGRFLF